MQKTALVTGASGFIGSHLVDYLLSKGYQVRATDLENADRKWLNKEAEFIPADLTKREALLPLLKDVNKIFHPAAVFDFSAPWDLFYKVNVEGTKNLCQAILDSDSNPESIIIWSSEAIYGPTGEKIVNEDDTVHPVNNYEKSKALQEEAALDFQKKQGLPITILRPAGAYGPRSQYGLAILLFLIAERILFAVPGNKKIRAVTVHVRDIVEAAEFLSNKEEAIGQVYNLNDDLSLEYTKGELLSYAAELMGRRMLNISLPMPLVYTISQLSEWQAQIMRTKPKIEKKSLWYIADNVLVDNSKLKRLGYKLVYPDTKVGIKETIEWYQKNKWI